VAAVSPATLKTRRAWHDEVNVVCRTCRQDERHAIPIPSIADTIEAPDAAAELPTDKIHINTTGTIVTPDRPDLIGKPFPDIRQIVKDNMLRDMEAPADDVVVVTADEAPTDLFMMLQIDNQPGNRFPVNARGLHEYLEIGRNFAAWITDRIEAFQFVDGEDYEVCSPKLASKECGVGSKGRGGHNAKEYRLTPTTARLLSADCRSERGRRVIRFLVSVVEKVAEAPAILAPKTYAEALRALADETEAVEQLKLENAKLEEDLQWEAQQRYYTENVALEAQKKLAETSELAKLMTENIGQLGAKAGQLEQEVAVKAAEVAEAKSEIDEHASLVCPLTATRCGFMSCHQWVCMPRACCSSTSAC